MGIGLLEGGIDSEYRTVGFMETPIIFTTQDFFFFETILLDTAYRHEINL